MTWQIPLKPSRTFPCAAWRAGAESTRARVRELVNVELLPVERRVAVDDDALFGPALEFFHQSGLARLERLGDFRMDAEREARAIQLRRHFARLRLRLVANGVDALDHAGAAAIDARLAEGAFE